MPPDAVIDAAGMVRRAQRVLIAVSIGSALLWAIGTATVIAGLTTRPTGVAAAFVIGALLIWRDRAVWSAERVALWIEEHHPGLDFALVTAVDPAARATAPDRSLVDALLARAVAAADVDPRRLVRHAAVRRIGSAVAGLAVSALLVAIMSRYPVRRSLARFTTSSLTHEPHGVDRLGRIAATVTPPAYSHLMRREVADPSEIGALVGSQLIVHGRGATEGMSASIGGAARRVVPIQDRWEVVVTMPAAPTLLRLTEEESGAAPVRSAPRHRLVTLIPTADEPPAVELLTPVRDSVMPRATGTLALRARATDDIGLEAGHFEIVVTAGNEDEGGVHARTLTVGSRSLDNARASQWQGSVRLDSLQLIPGAVLSIRAIARDGNTITGPGIGTSDTRTFRIARRDEYDSVAIESAAPSIADSSALSERVVIIGTNDLIARMTGHPPIARDSVAQASRRLADQQEAIRHAITSVISADDENELPIADVLSAPERALLDSAAYAMEEASARLAARTPQAALPAERRALTMVDSALSLARRVYLRSRPPRLLVDVAHVRLSGTDHLDPAPRSLGRPDTADAHWLDRLGAVGRLLVSASAGGGGRSTDVRQAAVDSLVVLRVTVLTSRPALAAALTQAIGTIHLGGDPTPALGRARALMADPVTATGLSGPGDGGGR